jgi:hypothetical protein
VISGTNDNYQSRAGDETAKALFTEPAHVAAVPHPQDARAILFDDQSAGRRTGIVALGDELAAVPGPAPEPAKFG